MSHFITEIGFDRAENGARKGLKNRTTKKGPNGARPYAEVIAFCGLERPDVKR